MNMSDSGLPPVRLSPELGRVADLVDRSLAPLAAELPNGLTCRLLRPSDGPAMRDFRLGVVERLADPDHYRMAGEVGDFVSEHLGLIGLTAGIFDGNRMAAYGALTLPDAAGFNRGHDFGLAGAELEHVAHVASAMVDPDYRGLGLHHRLIDWRLALAGMLQRWHLFTTVSPRNHQSWGHLAAHAIYPKRLIQVGNGLMRLLVHRDLRQRASIDPEALEVCPVDALSLRRDLFDDGYWVWGRCRMEGRVLALLARPRREAPAPVPAGQQTAAAPAAVVAA
ncbi:GNAT family N-acetyltransferase [Azospirillum sp. RWY-5-1]|uniref:GNAT family N-acetyltransferase n=1 Tax=Azospirillum oleiclasticum TaxID=2735135 RepID=A0ABX2TLF5_9PROT|nr:GNAT family N-acetyltransferase [Azospirillum oleiclasticum]NYZ17578.1 GNAT family N-acetyltransferase [Azospirillum oleiclasticum]NYZ24954.1 GNAT family N-acetyltransferase [Azospirillum oleiclasticum]